MFGVLNPSACRYNHLVQRIIPNSPASFTAIQLNEVLVTSSAHFPPPPSPTSRRHQLEVDGVDLSCLDTDSVRSLIVGPPGSSVRLLLSLAGHVSIKRTQFVRAPPASPPRAQAQRAVVGSPCFPPNAEDPQKRFIGETPEDC